MADLYQHSAQNTRKGNYARALLAILALLLSLAPALLAQSAQEAPKPAKPTGTAEVRIELTGGDDKRPVAEASVYVKFTQDGLLRDRPIELNLKSNQNGVARSPQIPKGRILIQIVAPGWRTFGKYYDVDQDEQVIQINLERPTNRWLQP